MTNVLIFLWFFGCLACWYFLEVYGITKQRIVDKLKINKFFKEYYHGAFSNELPLSAVSHSIYFLRKTLVRRTMNYYPITRRNGYKVSFFKVMPQAGVRSLNSWINLRIERYALFSKLELFSVTINGDLPAIVLINVYEPEIFMLTFMGRKFNQRDVYKLTETKRAELYSKLEVEFAEYVLRDIL